MSSRGLVQSSSQITLYPNHDAPDPLYNHSITCDAIRESNVFLFPTGVGEEPVREVLRVLCPHTPRDYQINAVTKLPDSFVPVGARP